MSREARLRPAVQALLIFFTTLTGCQHHSQRFYPLGIYSVNSTNDFPIVRDAGFNLITSAADPTRLDAARAHGLRILASPGTFAGKDFKASMARQTVLKYDSHPALWAWYLIDEPDMHGVSPRQIREAHRFVKRLGATKPTALVLFQGSTALEDLSDVHQVSALFARGQHLGHPGEPELSLTGGNHLLRHYINRAFQYGDIQAEFFIEALSLGRIITGELRLSHPLQLEANRG